MIEDDIHVGCQFTVDLGSFDVHVLLESELADCVTVAPHVDAVAAAVLEAIGQMSR